MSDSPALLPERHPDLELFVCDVADAVLKDLMQQMEHPFFSLSTRPDTTIRRYEHNGNSIEIVPSVKGLATIHDKDILIYCISQVMAALKRGEQVPNRVRINAVDLLRFTNRGTGGREYRLLCEALDRLDGTRIRTNVRTGDEEQFDAFGLIDAAAIRRKFGNNGRLLYCDIKLSDWVLNAIRANEVLTLHRDYFRLRKPLERRIYEIARKHCGPQRSWRVGIDTLRKKTGSQSAPKKFRELLRHIVQHDHLPDYSVSLEGDNVVFLNRAAEEARLAARIEVDIGPLSGEAYEDAKSQAPGWDVYYLEEEWRAWCAAEEIEPRNPNRHFLSFCVSWYEKRGRP